MGLQVKLHNHFFLGAAAFLAALLGAAAFLPAFLGAAGLLGAAFLAGAAVFTARAINKIAIRNFIERQSHCKCAPHKIKLCFCDCNCSVNTASQKLCFTGVVAQVVGWQASSGWPMAMSLKRGEAGASWQGEIVTFAFD